MVFDGLQCVQGVQYLFGWILVSEFELGQLLLVFLVFLVFQVSLL